MFSDGRFSFNFQHDDASTLVKVGVSHDLNNYHNQYSMDKNCHVILKKLTEGFIGTNPVDKKVFKSATKGQGYKISIYYYFSFHFILRVLV